MCVCLYKAKTLKKIHISQRTTQSTRAPHRSCASLASFSLFLPATSRTLDHQIGESGVHRRAKAVEHRQTGFDRIDSSLSMSMAMSALLRTGRRRRRRRGRGHQRRGRRRRSGHWRAVVVVATIDGTSRRGCREVEGLTLTGANTVARGRRRRECGATLLREEAGHRGRG